MVEYSYWWGVPHHPASPVTVEAAVQVQEFFSSFRAKAWRAVDGQAGKRCFFFYFYSIKRLDRLALLLLVQRPLSFTLKINGFLMTTSFRLQLHQLCRLVVQILLLGLLASNGPHLQDRVRMHPSILDLREVKGRS